MKPFRVICDNNYHECKGLGSVFVTNEIIIDTFDGKPIRITLNELSEVCVTKLNSMPESKPCNKEYYETMDYFKKVAMNNPRS